MHKTKKCFARLGSALVLGLLLAGCGKTTPLTINQTTLISALNEGIRAKICQALAGTNLRDRQLTEPGDEGLKAQQRVLAAYEEQIGRILPTISTKEEVEENELFFQDFFTDVDNDPGYVKRGQSIVDRLANARTRLDICYRIGVTDGPGLEAFGKGGALLIIPEGVIDLSESESAAIIAHELAHNEKRHYLRGKVATEINKLLKGKADQLLALSHASLDRKFEYEADADAVKLMTKAGYSLEGFRAVLERLKVGRNAKSAPLDDHPSPQERLDALKL